MAPSYAAHDPRTREDVVEKSKENDWRKNALAENGMSCGEGRFKTLFNIFDPNDLHTSQTASGEGDQALTQLHLQTTLSMRTNRQGGMASWAPGRKIES